MNRMYYSRYLLLFLTAGVLSGCSGSSGGGSSASTPLLSLAGGPSQYDSASNVSVNVTSPVMDKYKYKVGVKASTDCTDSSGYSAETSIATPLNIDLTVFSDSEISLCLLGGNDGVWQSEADATVITWVKDTQAPTSPSSLAIGTTTSGLTSSPILHWTSGVDTGPGATYEEVGVFKTSDNTQVGTWTSLVSGNVLTGLSLIDGTSYYYKVRTSDQAGNKSSAIQGTSWTAVDPNAAVALISPPAGLDDCVGVTSGGACTSGARLISIADAGYGTKVFMTTPGNCTSATTNPVCDNGTDTLMKHFISTGGSQGITGGGCIAAGGYGSNGAVNTTLAAALTDADAPKYCNDLVYAGYSDWYLPSREELTVLGTNRANFPSLANAEYWTSTVVTFGASGFTCGMNLGSSPNRYYNYDSIYLRCIRKTDLGVLTTSSVSEFQQTLPAQSAWQTVTVTNPYTQATGTLATSITTDFEINSGNNNCSGIILAAGANCTLQVRGKATTSKFFSGVLTVASTFQSIKLNLTGIAFRDSTASLVSGDIFSDRTIYTGTTSLMFAGDSSAVLRYYMSTPSGCTDTVTNPVCDNSADAVVRKFGVASQSYSPLSNQDGAANSAALIALPNTDAAKYCSDLVYAGYSDWYLPASGEGSKISNYTNGVEYWMSEDLIRTFPGSSSTNPALNATAYRVRCVRRFIP